MKFEKLEVENFRAISNIKLHNLKDVVLIAGPNGCGKSCIFDAIRLFKSMYGEYSQSELNNWFNEFQIGLNQNKYQFISDSLLPDFQNVNKPMRIYAELKLMADEINWLKGDIEFIVKSHLWKKYSPQQIPRVTSISEQARFLKSIPPQVFKEEEKLILDELDKTTFVGEIIIAQNAEPIIRNSPVLEKVFSMYIPDSIGIIDYHSPQRNYNREQMNQVNLNIETRERNSSQHALYNTVNKYNGVKTELASSYIVNLLSKEAGKSPESSADLNKTLQELFSNFFPDKTFLGPQPTKDGKLTFNVRTSYGSIHDIDGLSSGEKEILYGYLRIRNSAPKNSVLLIDEPELHLNPKLTQGLPSFYHRHLGKALNNQVWLVTHSDALLRQSIGQENFSVFHLQKAEDGSNENQVKEISASDELEQAVIDLVGDLAAYRPGAKLVIVEGGGDSDFDVQMIRQLFPDFDSRVNLESAGGKKRVGNFQELLEKAKKSGAITTKIYAITDKDFESEFDIDNPAQENKFSWDRFHIENYLLETKYILKVINDIRPRNLDIPTEIELEGFLKRCAKSTMPSLVREIMEHSAHQKLSHCIKTKIDRNSQELSSKLAESISSSIERINKVTADALSVERLNEKEKALKEKYTNDLTTNEWKKSFRGRDILKELTSSYLRGSVNYEIFCNLIISKMHDENYQPEGMRDVLNKILSLH